MQKKKRAWEKGSFCGVLLGALAIASTVAKADTFGVQLAGGVADHGVKKLDLGGVWDPNLTCPSLRMSRCWPRLNRRM